MSFARKYTPQMQTDALDLLRKAQDDDMPIMQACELVAALLDNDDAGRPKPEKLRKWAKEAGLFPDSDLRLRFGADKRSRAVATVEQLVAAGDNLRAACERVAAQEGASLETVRSWYYRRREDEPPGRHFGREGDRSGSSARRSGRRLADARGLQVGGHRVH